MASPESTSPQSPSDLPSPNGASAVIPPAARGEVDAVQLQCSEIAAVTLLVAAFLFCFLAGFFVGVEFWALGILSLVVMLVLIALTLILADNTTSEAE